MIKKNICFLISVVLLVSAAACHNTNSFESSKASEIITSPSISETNNLSDTDSQTGLSADPDMETALSADDATIDNSEYSSTDSDSDDAVSTDSADVASDVEGSLSNEQVSETDAAAWIKAKLPAYTLRYGEGEKLHLNKDGELIIDDGYYWDTLTDVFTGEITYYTCLRYEITYVNTEGYDNDIIGYNRLYDTDGELVRDWENCDYGYACGDLVIKRPFSPWLSNDTSFDSILLDPIEDELILNDVYYIGKVNNNRALCLNDSDEPICMLDRTGQIAVSLPDNYKIREAEVSNGIIIAEIAYGDDDWHDAILNEDFEVLLEAPEDAYYTNLYEYGYIELSTNGINTKFYDSSDYHLVYETDTTVYYFDGDRAITGEYDDMKLETTEGWHEGDSPTHSGDHILAGPFEYIWPLTGTGVSEYFLAFNSADNYASVIDRNGKTVSLYDGKEFYRMTTSDGVIVRETHVGDDNNWEWYCTLYDINFNEIIPESKGYSYIYSEKAEGDNTHRIWICSRDTDYFGGYIDVYNDNFEPIIQNVYLVGEHDEQGIAICKGFYIGLVGYDGSWITRNSRFTMERWD